MIERGVRPPAGPVNDSVLAAVEVRGDASCHIG
jgi:hypothetical protein